MNTPGQLSKRVEWLEQHGNQKNKIIIQFPELRNILKKYYEEGYSDEQASEMAGQYFVNKYVLGKGRYTDAQIEKEFERYD
jgi:hypothetical protein